MRQETRLQRIHERLPTARSIPNSSFVIPQLANDENLGLIIRSAVAFGIESAYVIGKLPEYRELRKTSCSTCNYIDIQAFPNPLEFIRFVRGHNLNLIGIDITDKSIPIHQMDHSIPNPCFALGHENYGIPVDLLVNTVEDVYIPMPGPTPCINVSIASAIVFQHVAFNRGI